MSKTKKVRKIMKAAKMGKPAAMYDLGLRYELGCGVEQDADYAFYWIMCAANEGFAPAVAWMQDYMFDDNAETQALD